MVRAFVNTADFDEGTEQLDSPVALAEWLRRNAIEPGPSLGPRDLERSREFREHLRSLLLSNNGIRLDRSGVSSIQKASRPATVRFRVDADGRVDLEPEGSGVDALIGAMLAIVHEAQREGVWARLKACPGEACAWAFYDESRNSSRSWCSMAVCGNRAKTRRYRESRSGRRRA